MPYSGIRSDKYMIIEMWLWAYLFFTCKLFLLTHLGAEYKGLFLTVWKLWAEHMTTFGLKSYYDWKLPTMRIFFQYFFLNPYVWSI